VACKLDGRKIRKWFIVRVNAKKYEGWRYSPYYKKLGGLYGLLVGARFKREITAKILFKDTMPYELYEMVISRLEDRGYEIESMGKLDPRYHVRYAVFRTVEEFKADTDEEITAKAKQFCRELKESIANEVAEVIRETVEYVLENEDVFYDLVEVLKEVM